MPIKLCVPSLEAKSTDASGGDDPLLKKAKKYLEELSRIKVSNNCQKFAVALELKFRGISKKPTPTEHPCARVFDVPKGKAYPIENWCMFRDAKFTPIKGDVIESITKTMNDWGKHSRAIISVAWKSGRGHVFNLINTENGVYLMDGTANRIKPVEKSDYLKNKVDVKASLGLIRSDTETPDSDMLKATFDEEGDVRFSLQKVEADGRTHSIRSMSTKSILSYLRYWKPRKGEIFIVHGRLKGDDSYANLGKIRCIGVTAKYGEDLEVYGYEWI